MFALMTLSNSMKQLLTPKVKLRLRTLIHPVRAWKRKVGLRELYPASWRWVVMSDNIQGFLSAAEGNALYCLARDFTPQENAVVGRVRFVERKELGDDCRRTAC